jgi:hypothetical protein
MFDARDFEGIAEVVGTYAILADSEAELDRFHGLKPFDVAFPVAMSLATAWRIRSAVGWSMARSWALA